MDSNCFYNIISLVFSRIDFNMSSNIMILKRDKLNQLIQWRTAEIRKPLIVRGARQVGKTSLVREFAKSFSSFVEINFEKQPQFSGIFKLDLDPKRILSELSLATGKKIQPGETLLFFDEIQQSPEAYKSLRYFYEELPQYHLIAAGSLLGFLIENVSTGVGRVSYLDLYPLTFGEYLDAMGASLLRQKILNLDLDTPLLEIHHHKLLQLVKSYMLIGGMPAVVSAFVEKQDYLICQRIQDELIKSFSDDFVKYAKISETPYLNKVFSSIPGQIGKKFIYSRVDRSIRSHHFSKSLNLLETAGIVYKVYQSKASGLPLQSQIKSSAFKVIFFDIGLLQRLMKINLEMWVSSDNIETAYKGAIAEQFVGQELATLTEASKLNNLVYWHREERNSSAEVDYILDINRDVIPVEVKSNIQGGMKSMALFLKEKRKSLGIKISKYPFSYSKNIRTIPFYAIEKIFHHDF